MHVARYNVAVAESALTRDLFALIIRITVEQHLFSADIQSVARVSRQ